MMDSSPRLAKDYYFSYVGLWLGLGIAFSDNIFFVKWHRTYISIGWFLLFGTYSYQA